ncbi:uncharacterized protein TRIADDRAFT_61174 [Trichoplax adhaerens]|uniref:MARVEL domain-containing protein n=1 Tax=Trichoplax adhaerens TaxID=10228 RepID=B3SA86_TRIAD|nr:predicted protein [Trichoplax adhaerens]EDV20471.1 predicted protein [Trichoplax adhaerens]|eukprot:XP_002117165.1 predicted protein [Trichoplax adhaerens]
MGEQVQIQTQQPQVVYQACCGNFGKILPENRRKTCYGIGVTMLITGIVSFIVGIVGIFTTAYSYYSHGHYIYIRNATVFVGADIWAGVFYILCGIFAIASHKNRANSHLMNSYFAFAIISFILSIPHFIVSLAYMVSNRFGLYIGGTIWFNIVSIILSVSGFILSLTSVVILGNGIYCNNTTATNVTTVHYQTGPSQVVAFQQYPTQYPNQPVIAFQQAPVYVQTPQAGQVALNYNQTDIGATSKTQLPPLYDKLPNVGEKQMNPGN